MENLKQLIRQAKTSPVTHQKVINLYKYWQYKNNTNPIVSQILKSGLV